MPGPSLAPLVISGMVITAIFKSKAVAAGNMSERYSQHDLVFHSQKVAISIAQFNFYIQYPNHENLKALDELILQNARPRLDQGLPPMN